MRVRAIAACDAALQLQPEHRESYFYLARCYVLSGNTQMVLQNLERQFELAPEVGRKLVKESDEFDGLRNNARFQALMQVN